MEVRTSSLIAAIKKYFCGKIALLPLTATVDYKINPFIWKAFVNYKKKKKKIS